MRGRTRRGLAKHAPHRTRSHCGWAWLLLIVLLPAAAGAAEEDADIVLLCHLVIGEFGYDAIDICVQGNRAARAELRKRSADTPAAVAHCTRQWEPDWVMAQRCLDAELAAAAALRDYAGDAATLTRCREQFAEGGDTRVKACVDRASSAARSPRGAAAADDAR